MGLSLSHVSKTFKENTGKNFRDYVSDLRIEQSKKLLCNTNLKVGEIANMVGYPDDKYFCRLFKNKTKLKPSEYRKLYS